MKASLPQKVRRSVFSKTMYEPVREDTNNLGSTRSDTKRAVLSQKMEILDLESRDPYSKNKCDEHRCYCEADLRLCFCLCRLLDFPIYMYV